MKIFNSTTILDGYLPPLANTDNKSLAEVILVRGRSSIHLVESLHLRGIFKTGLGTDNLPFEEAAQRDDTIHEDI